MRARRLEAGTPRPLEWIGSSKKDPLALPREVIRVFGHALHLAQIGARHGSAKPLHGFGAGVTEVVEDWRGNAYRAVYLARYRSRVFVLHVFQKKSTSGSATPRPQVDLIRERLKVAQTMMKELEDVQS